MSMQHHHVLLIREMCRSSLLVTNWSLWDEPLPCVLSQELLLCLVCTQRSVRCEAARLLGQLVSIASRAAAPHLRVLLGPWLLAQHDPHTDTASVAQVGFQVCNLNHPVLRKHFVFSSGCFALSLCSLNI